MTDGQPYDAIVVGGGVVGASLAHHLMLRGLRRVLVCEQGRFPGAGATSRSGGLLRQHHTTHADTRLAVQGLRAYQDWAERVGGDCGYRRTGFAMVVAESYADSLAKNTAAVQEAGGRAYLTEADELAAEYPGLRLDRPVAVSFEPDGGYADPAAAASDLLASARRRGAVLAEGVRVTSVTVSGDRVTGVTGNLGAFSAPLVLLAGGAWSREPAATAGVDLPVEPRRIGIARGRTGEPGHALPVCIDDTLGTYFRPEADGGLWFGVPADPAVPLDGWPTPLTGAEVDAARRNLAPRVPALTGALIDGSRSGLDGYTPDRRPLIGPVGPEGLYACTGFSGGGFKTAPAVGELVAAEVTGGAPEELLAPYRPGRFGAGTPAGSDFPYGHM
ncbi:NAD(P)/FAD-dependent oxidoreductase [Actinacidiphila acididurans]|uniref:FAD-binding oxidoreductase n=1 Tax=Actinacidiphila acididurans TaxID=2784346 RepID=A0ABS2TQ70_9ACTN|nr:FAD-binding oxidoreductase [Actinacidiphila acididurans]MBM9504113.1 FAD-binding oxidoreductase [Actinacidiphila acididurans]